MLKGIILDIIIIKDHLDKKILLEINYKEKYCYKMNKS